MPQSAVFCRLSLEEGDEELRVGFHLAPPIAVIGPSRSKFDVAANLCLIISPSFVADKKAVDRPTARRQSGMTRYRVREETERRSRELMRNEPYRLEPTAGEATAAGIDIDSAVLRVTKD